MKGSTPLPVTWSATSPQTGRYPGVPVSTPGGELLARFAELRERGAGHCEVEIDGQEYPWLMVSFEGEYAIVHAFFAEQDSALLEGNGLVSASDEVEVTIAEDEYATTFTGQFVSTVDRAEEVLVRFICGHEPGSLGRWYNL